MFAKLCLVNNIADWIENAQAARGWTQAELARRAGISQGAISRVISGSRNAGVDFCRAIAKAFSVPEQEVLQVAGLLDKVSPETTGQDEMAYIYANLPAERQAQLREYARFLLDQDEKRDRQATRPSPATR